MPSQNDYPHITSSSPVNPICPDREDTGPEEGVALCLSGGGYRAMLFHTGVIWRLNEAGLLPKINRISSVSGGSITAGVLGAVWKKLDFDNSGVANNLPDKFVSPIRKLACKTLDIMSVITGVLCPFSSIAEKVAAAYDKYLFKDAMLENLPSDNEGPRFIFNATNLQSGALWRFSKPYMADYLVGRIFDPKIKLATAVAASSAFPPFLSPLKLRVKPTDFHPDPNCPLQKEPFTSHVILSDGGIYDNLGLETAWKRYKTVLVSDAGSKMSYEKNPKQDWPRQAYRVLNVIDNQVRSLRKRQLLASYTVSNNNRDYRKGAFWGIRTNIKDYHLPNVLHCPHDKTLRLANIKTGLKKLDDSSQQKLINWGYAICDAALRKYCSDPTNPIFGVINDPNGFPYAGGV